MKFRGETPRNFAEYIKLNSWSFSAKTRGDKNGLRELTRNLAEFSPGKFAFENFCSQCVNAKKVFFLWLICICVPAFSTFSHPYYPQTRVFPDIPAYLVRKCTPPYKTTARSRSPEISWLALPDKTWAPTTHPCTQCSPSDFSLTRVFPL